MDIRQRGWLFALSALPLSALFSITLMYFTAAYFRGAALNSIQQAAHEGLYQNASQLLDTAQHIDLLAARLPLFKLDPIPTEQYVLLITLGGAVTSRDSDAIHEFLKYVEGNDRLSPLEGDLKKFIVANDQARSERKILSIPTEKRDTLTANYRKILSELGTLISMVVLDEVSTFTFYSDGVFAELPVLPSIPNSPKTLEELKRILDQKGGSVQIPREERDPKAYFLGRLDHLRSESRSVQVQFEELGVDISALHKASRGLAKIDKLEDLEGQITLKISRILAGLVEQS